MTSVPIAKRLLLKAVRSADDWLHRGFRGGRRSVLFDGETAMHFAMFETLYGSLRRDPRVRCRFTSSWDGGLKLPVERVCALLSADRADYVPYDAASWRKWDLYVSSCFDNPWLARNVPRADIFHGVGEKWVNGGERLYMCHPLGARYDRLLCPNRRLAEQFERRPAFRKTADSLRVTGLAKADVLVWFNTEEVRAALRKALPLDPRRPVVLLAPTWGAEGLLERHGRRVLEACARADVNLVVKLHACSYLGDARFSGGTTWRSRMDVWARELGFLHLPDANLTALMLLADAAIADFGSAPVEYCLVDRPLLFFAVESQAVATGGDRHQFTALCRAGQASTTPAELEARLGAALRGEDAAAEERRKLVAEFFPSAGSATDNALRELYAMMELPRPAGAVEAYREARRANILADAAGYLGLPAAAV